MGVVYNFGLFADNELPLLFLVEAASNCKLVRFAALADMKAAEQEYY